MDIELEAISRARTTHLPSLSPRRVLECPESGVGHMDRAGEGPEGMSLSHDEHNCYCFARIVLEPFQNSTRDREIEDASVRNVLKCS